jgi:hypothetical protein
VRKWIDESLNFRQSYILELEKRHGALKGLRVLVDTLAFMTEQEDLLVLSPLAEFAAIPVHGFSPHLECICRVQVCDSPQDMSLASAISAAAYGEPGHGEERAMIFQNMKELSNHFGARHLLECDLTATSFKSALNHRPGYTVMATHTMRVRSIELLLCP